MNLHMHSSRSFSLKNTNTTNSIFVGANTYVLLPESILLYSSSNALIPINPPTRNYSIYMNNIKAKGTTLAVNVSATLDVGNHSIYTEPVSV